MARQQNKGWTALVPEGSHLVAQTEAGEITVLGNAHQGGSQAGGLRLTIKNSDGSRTALTLSPTGELLGFARGPMRKNVIAQLDAQDRARRGNG